MQIEPYYKSKAKATIKLRQALASYLFEQEFGELRKASHSEIETLIEASKILSKIIDRYIN